MEVPTPKPKPQETYVQQKLIVISLRRKLFLEKQDVVKDELAAGWHIKDIQLGVGEKGTTGFMSILLERELCITTETLPDGSTTLQPWFTTTNQTHQDPHGLDGAEPYTMQDGEPIDPDQPYTFNDDGPEEENNDDEAVDS